MPTVGTLERIAEVLEVTVADLTLGDSPRELAMELIRGMTDAEVLALLRRLGGDVETPDT